MNLAAQKIETDLAAYAPLGAVVGEKHYRGLAPKNAKVPFIVYKIKENKRATKDYTREYEVQIYCFQNSLTNASTLSDLVRDAMPDTEYRYQGGSEDYSDLEGKEAYVELNFNFKIRI